MLPWKKSCWSVQWDTIYTTFPSQPHPLVDMFQSSHSMYHTNSNKTILLHIAFTLFLMLWELNSSLFIITLCNLGHIYTFTFVVHNFNLVPMNNVIIELEKYLFFYYKPFISHLVVIYLMLWDVGLRPRKSTSNIIVYGNDRY